MKEIDDTVLNLDVRRVFCSPSTKLHQARSKISRQQQLFSKCKSVRGKACPMEAWDKMMSSNWSTDLLSEL